MARKTRTARTTVTEFEEQELSIRALSLRPEVFQSRARLDKKWSNQYSKDMAKGDAFPPILVYRLPDGTMVVVDGFHRIDAAQAIGKKSIRCQIRNGTEQDALLAAIEANMADFHRGRPFQEEDRRRAVELMIRHGAGYPGTGTWDWSDPGIAKRCGVSGGFVRKVRDDLLKTEGVPLPKNVTTFNSDGSPSGTRRYRNSRTTGKPTIILNPSKGAYTAHIGGKVRYLSRDKQEAEQRAAELAAEAEKPKVSLGHTQSVVGWLFRRGVPARPVGGSWMFGGIQCGETFIAVVAEPSTASTLSAVGLASIAVSSGVAKNAFLMGHKEDRSPAACKAVSLAAEGGFILGFMTPEEVVAEFGPKEEA